MPHAYISNQPRKGAPVGSLGRSPAARLSACLLHAFLGPLARLPALPISALLARSVPQLLDVGAIAPGAVGTKHFLIFYKDGATDSFGRWVCGL